MANCEHTEHQHVQDATMATTLTGDAWIVTYHEHLGNPCVQVTQPTLGCRPMPPVIAFDCQATSGGFNACTHVEEDPAISVAASGGKRPLLAWLLNGAFMSYYGHSSKGGRNPMPIGLLLSELDEMAANANLTASSSPTDEAGEI